MAAEEEEEMDLTSYYAERAAELQGMSPDAVLAKKYAWVLPAEGPPSRLVEHFSPHSMPGLVDRSTPDLLGCNLRVFACTPGQPSSSTPEGHFILALLSARDVPPLTGQPAFVNCGSIAVVSEKRGLSAEQLIELDAAHLWALKCSSSPENSALLNAAWLHCLCRFQIFC